MNARESFGQFKERLGVEPGAPAQVYVNRIEHHNAASNSLYQRRDFYKIMLFEKADGALRYGDRAISVTNRALVFTNSMIPYSWEGDRDDVRGFICVFTEAFITGVFKSGGIADVSLFKPGGEPVLYPDREEFAWLQRLFQRMMEDYASDYPFKQDLIRSYVEIMVHDALKMSPEIRASAEGSSYARISRLFLDLLDRQFPILASGDEIGLKNANEFAARLGMHTNHLNKALREYTGKTTTEHIAIYVTREAKALLLHSDWTIGEIASALGFNHASNFDIFFKRHVGQTPLQFRKMSRLGSLNRTDR